MTTIYVKWGESRVKLTWEKNNKLPQNDLITSVRGFCFQGNKLLLVDLNHRGWDFPGGHIESDETPEECCKREAMEEGYIEGECELLGHIIVDHSENPLWNETSPYPKIGFQVFYKMHITKLHPFEAKYESAQRKSVNPNETSSYHHEWNSLYQEILDCALQ
ncbi:NUDIX domain-containing protein [Bacillus sp. FJAT-51639]|uniref:NUDIX domain-containing protein n=1 Tax=Bacillus bruguierae TaxID=3127667 RepID=A0ABU8FKJ4_9BACI